MGYEVLEMFTHAEHGLAYLEETVGTEEFPDAVILDMNLKGKLTGLDAAKQIYAKYKCGVMFLTGLGQIETIERAFRQKPVPFLIKPFDTYQVHISLQIAIYLASLENELKQLKMQQSTGKMQE